MAVRPFYLSADVEGRRTPLAGGPARRDGSMTVEIIQRNAGEIETAFKIRSYREGDELITNVYDSTGTCVATHKTPY